MNSTEDAPLGNDMAVDIVGSRSSQRAQSSRDKQRNESNREVTERRDLSDEDRINMFREQLFNDALPDLPPIPGYRTIWLTTTNSRDPIQRRLQLGYEFLTPADVPGFEYATLKTGDYAGVIGVNEMIACKLPERLWQAYMREAHHEAPLRDEQRIRDAVEAMEEQAKSSKGALIMDEGFAELQSSRPPQGRFD